MKKLISLILICLMISGCGNKGYETIDSNVAIGLIDDGAIVIDVRSEEEYDTGHIEGALNIPLGDIDGITYEKDKTIIVYCASGMRSLEAVETLKEMGYTSLYNLDGGLLNWGFELEE